MDVEKGDKCILVLKYGIILILIFYFDCIKKLFFYLFFMDVNFGVIFGNEIFKYLVCFNILYVKMLWVF